MNGAADFSLVSRVAQPTSRGIVARIEKISSCNGLQNGPATQGGPRQERQPRTSQNSVSQFETPAGSHWHGPRLSAPFVAQVLGQVLPPDAPNAASAHAAYAGNGFAHRGALVCSA